mmetsp:Transcript_15990/g.18070  ORF Transcript_15990/g.18070 Transcript_15990/m.18070 type:complete len:107 (+) Transcript_15990:105-425(+)
MIGGDVKDGIAIATVIGGLMDQDPETETEAMATAGGAEGMEETGQDPEIVSMVEESENGTDLGQEIEIDIAVGDIEIEGRIDPDLEKGKGMLDMEGEFGTEIDIKQ